jgi:kynurenine formamidase
MRGTIAIHGQLHAFDLGAGIDLSLPLRRDANGPRAWYVPKAIMTPVEEGPWIGSVALGGSVNFFNVAMNPHGHGTHTEGLGHITPEHQSVASIFNPWCLARVHSIDTGADPVIHPHQLPPPGPEKAIILRTLPNDVAKKTRQWDGFPWPYLSPDAAKTLREQGIVHLLIDGPSVDPERDEGKLSAHHAFWDVPNHPRLDATITELIFVPDTAPDGLYVLNLQMAHWELDATPSRPVIYPLTHV